ncbi:branched-chain amino acid ABC transporter permease [Hamadaea tsunoensis]|uniref:branched-chain amino acid ABC transporter permease n=1 Tax=Hamadaea tsunoensis TaxID=53368 RepID=UPI000409D9D0|nr:branched-chain amino acid ABC transporter permease [Hamadaea tsunoensis]
MGIADAAAIGLLYFVIASGLTLILGSLRILSLAHGSVYLAGGYLAWLLHADTPSGFVLACGAAIPTGIAIGGLCAAVTWPLRAYGHLAQALATLGLSLIGGQLIAAATGGTWLPAKPPPPLAAVINLAGHRYPAYRLGFIAVAAVIAAGLWWVMTLTRAGIVVRAVADDAQMAASTGIRPSFVHTGVFAAGTTLAVLAGVLAAPILPAGPGVDEQLLVWSLIIVVLGGPGDLRGALAASLAAGTVSAIGVVVLPTLAPFLLLVLVLVALVVRPAGLGRSLA